MATWRVHVKANAGDGAKMDAFKNEVQRFKKLYSHGGLEAVFEFPESNEAGAEQLAKEATAEGFTAKKEKYVDPLESVEGSADFW